MIDDPSHCWSRREILKVGSLSLFAAPAAALARQASVFHAAANASPVSPGAAAQPSATGCIFLLLQGGPSHLDLWDPKPESPAEIRGPFSPISTSVPGIQFGEMLPRLSQLAQHLTVVRSMTHAFNNHIAGTYIALTGSASQPNIDREAHPDDSPGPGAILNYLRGAYSSVPASISLPTWLSIPGPSNRMPGQYGGFLGSVYDPFLVSGEPQQADFKPLALLRPVEISAERLNSRKHLLAHMNSLARALEAGPVTSHDHLRDSALGLLSDERFRQALDLSTEPQATKEMYGLTKIGQSLLLARRLIEVGVCLVGYNAFNQEWDTHGGLKGRYGELVPPLDQALSALISDLHDRGLLDRTAVVCTGEFGRTPVINKDAGRDHWPDVYSLAVAGGGFARGRVHGTSDKRGAFVGSQGLAPADLLATLWHLLGINGQTELRDRLNRPHRVSDGTICRDLLA